MTLARAADAALQRGDVEAVRERLALLERTAAENLAEARLIVAALTPATSRTAPSRRPCSGWWTPPPPSPGSRAS